MKTSKPISTISFNTVRYLELKLNELLKAKKISFWAFIEHLPEDDEGGNKSHCHVYAEPSKMVQTDDLKAELMEYDPTKPTKPLGCLPWRSTNFDNWYLYALHDSRYLASKQQSRRYHYKHSQILTSDDENLTFLTRIIDLSALSPIESMKQAQALGMSFDEYFSNGRVPIPQISQFQSAWQLLLSNSTDRNGKPGHANDVDDGTELDIDELTGEILEPNDLELDDLPY